MSDEWKCPECHLDYGTLQIPNAIATVRSLPRRFREALADLPDEDTDAVIRTRPAEGVWSAIEYTAHVADLLPVFAETLEQMNLHTNPEVGGLWWDPDQKAVDDSYNTQDRTALLDRLQSGADALVAVAEGVDAHSWSRMGQFPWGERDMAVMLKNAAHEGVHHLKDVEQGLERVRNRS